VGTTSGKCRARPRAVLGVSPLGAALALQRAQAAARQRATRPIQNRRGVWPGLGVLAEGTGEQPWRRRRSRRCGLKCAAEIGAAAIAPVPSLPCGGENVASRLGWRVRRGQHVTLSPIAQSRNVGTCPRGKSPFPMPWWPMPRPHSAANFHLSARTRGEPWAAWLFQPRLKLLSDVVQLQGDHPTGRVR